MGKTISFNTQDKTRMSALSSLTHHNRKTLAREIRKGKEMKAINRNDGTKKIAQQLKVFSAFCVSIPVTQSG